MICAICSQAMCSHSDLEYAGIIPPRHSPVGSHRVQRNTVPAPFKQPQTGSTHANECGGSGFASDANDDEASQHNAAQYTDEYIATSSLTMIFDPVIVRDGNKVGVWL